MCLVVFAWNTHPEYRLLLAANRDEFHGRPARELHWWPDAPEILAGRDLQAGGTWLAMHRDGRFATVTNYRERQRKPAGLRSRGELVTGFVAGEGDPGTYIEAVNGEQYGGFSLLAADGDALWYVSNRGDGPTPLEAGIYGLSNASLDTPWPKLVRARDGLRALVQDGDANESAMLRLMADRSTAPAHDIDNSELPFEVARALTAPFIVSSDYGTRCTTVLTWANDGRISLRERRFDANGDKTGESAFRFDAEHHSPT